MKSDPVKWVNKRTWLKRWQKVYAHSVNFGYDNYAVVLRQAVIPCFDFHSDSCVVVVDQGVGSYDNYCDDG